VLTFPSLPWGAQKRWLAGRVSIRKKTRSAIWSQDFMSFFSMERIAKNGLWRGQTKEKPESILC
jgi:hypothetical protein